jgi:hypothetical protein
MYLQRLEFTQVDTLLGSWTVASQFASVLFMQELHSRLCLGFSILPHVSLHAGDLVVLGLDRNAGASYLLSSPYLTTLIWTHMQIKLATSLRTAYMIFIVMQMHALKLRTSR